MESRNIKLFGSYAHLDDPAASEVMNKLFVHLQSAKGFTFSLWTDRRLLLGEKWDPEIKAAMEQSDGGLLMVSPAFLSRDYIRSIELPYYLGKPDKAALPVLLSPVDFDRMNLLGLEHIQLFRLKGKAHSELGPQERDEFIFELFKAVYDRIKKVFG